MADRYLITKDSLVEGAAVPEQIKLKQERNTKLAAEKKAAVAAKKKEYKQLRSSLKMRTLKYNKEYATHERKLVDMRREAKVAGNFFVEPEAKLLFVVRIRGILKLPPKPRKQLHNGTFLKVNKPVLNMLKLVQPYVTYGFPTLK